MLWLGSGSSSYSVSSSLMDLKWGEERRREDGSGEEKEEEEDVVEAGGIAMAGRASLLFV